MPKRRRADELKCFQRIRSKNAVEDVLCGLEIVVLESSGNSEEKALWSALLKSSNGRRTAIACFIMALQQLTGVTFGSSCGPTIYKQQGLEDMLFFVCFE